MSLQIVHIGSGAHPATCPKGTGVLPSEIKRPERDVDHLRTSSVEGKNDLSYTFTTPVYLHGVDRGIFTIFTFSVSVSDYITSNESITDEFERS